ncbi:MAG: FG-GAP-like repeat-containing protein [Nitrospirota bacterium]|nr:FG-GAP-like repeat-containing protein [Nitrospirota bacterium]
MERLRRGFVAVLCLLVSGLAGQAAAYEKPTIGFVQNLDGIESPQRVSANGSGTIYVTDSYENEVIVLDSSGSKIGSIKESGVPRGIKVLPDNSILVGYTSDSGGYVSHYTSSGSFIRRLGAGIGQFTMPTDMAVNPSTGVIYVVDSVRSYVYRFDKDGNFLDRFGGYGPGYYDYAGFHNQFDYPAGIVFDAARQEVLVGDQGNFRIKVFDPAGNYLRQFGTNAPDSSWLFGSFSPEKLIGRFSKLQGLAIDGQSRLYVVDSFQCTVQMFDSASGNPLGMFGDYGTGSAELMVPIGITLSPSGQFILADWNNNRLSFWQIGLETSPPPSPDPNSAPSVPALSSPANGATVASMMPLLSVANASDAEGDMLQYIFQVDTSSSFNTANMKTVTVSQGTSVTSATVVLPVDHVTYYWRAKAKETSTSELLESGWSAATSFTVHASNRLPSAPGNLSPAAGTQLVDTDSLSWSSSVDPDGDLITYTVNVATDAAFASIVESKSGISGTSVAITQFSSLSGQPSATYYWQVKAVDSNSGSSTYSGSSFVYGSSGATIKVSSSPSGALVYIDGNYGYLGNYQGQTGATPLAITVEPGRHEVRIVRNGYNEYYGSYNMTAGQTVTVNANLLSYSSYSITDRGRLTAGGQTLGNYNPSFTYSSPFAVDWDNDGNKDLLVGANDGRVYYYNNTGGDGSPNLQYQGYVVSTGDGAYPFVVDWDNDGRKDLLVGTRSGNILLYLNIGTDSAPSFGGGVPLQAGGSVIDVGNYASPWVVDWDNDGKKDMLVGNSSGYVRLYLNSGTDSGPSLSDNGYLRMGSNTLRAGNYATPLVIDWDHDGRKDLVVGASSNGVYWFRNGGSDASPSFSSYSQLPELSGRLKSTSYAAPFIVDWNNSGLYDVLVGGSDGTVRRFSK